MTKNYYFFNKKKFPNSMPYCADKNHRKFVDHYQFSKLKDRCKNMLTNFFLPKLTSWNIVQQIMYDIFSLWKAIFLGCQNFASHITYLLEKTWVEAHFGIQQIFWVNEKLIQFVPGIRYTFGDAVARIDFL